MKRNLWIGAAFVVAAIALGITERALEQTAQAQSRSGQVPVFEVDPFWPKAMPNNWVFGQTIGLGVDERDQVWIIHRGNDMSRNAQGQLSGNLDTTEYAHPWAQPAEGARPYYAPGPTRVSECCDPAPPVVAFDQAGNVVHAWGGPSLHPDWPDSNHGIIVDLGGERRDPVGGEAARRLADGFGHLAEGEIEPEFGHA